MRPKSEQQRWFGLALGLVALLGVGCQAAPPEGTQSATEPVVVTSGLDVAAVRVGKTATWTVEIDRAADVTTELADPGAEVGGLAVLDTQREETQLARGRVRERRSYQVRPDLAGSYVLPEITVRWRAAGDTEAPWQEATAPRLFFEATPLEVVSAEDGGDIRDIKPIEPRPPFPWWIVAVAVGVLALAAAGWFGWRWWSRRRAKVTPPAPPWEIAWARLEALRALDLEDEAALRDFHFGLSEILRSYVEALYGINATDLTTEEITAQLDAGLLLSGEPRRAFERVLAAADRVKFARHQPSSTEVATAWELALSVVESTRAVHEATPTTPATPTEVAA